MRNLADRKSLALVPLALLAAAAFSTAPAEDLGWPREVKTNDAVLVIYQPQPESLEGAWIDYVTGEPSAARCADAVLLPLPAAAQPRRSYDCDGTAESLGARVRRWLHHDSE